MFDMEVERATLSTCLDATSIIDQSASIVGIFSSAVFESAWIPLDTHISVTKTGLPSRIIHKAVDGRVLVLDVVHVVAACDLVY